MHKKKYLIYLDILGFEELAKEISNRSGFNEDKIRQDYLSVPLRNKIEEIKKERVQTSKGISAIEGSDDFVLIVNEIETVFEIIAKLTKIKIHHKDYGYIPLEIALGVCEIDENITIDPINQKEVIIFLKNDIINPYREHYKTKYRAKIKKTFVVLTKEVYKEIKSQIHCKEIISKKQFFIADVKMIQRWCEIHEFLERIKGGSIYNRINDVYVPPVEYEDIKKTLKKDRFVIITGTPEYGKTYTAIKLLWEYYKKGYEPKWIKGEEEPERREVRKRLEDIETELKPKHIIYFEDPFGKIKYEKREPLEREIGTIIVKIKDIKNSYVIITSRDEIFKEFEKETVYSPNTLKEFEIKLNIKKPSYNYEKRKEILLKWAEKENCRWIDNEKLKELVLNFIKDETILPTPLSIKDFAIATRNITTSKEIEEKIKEKSKETAKSFANEIKNMSDDKILFLSFPFISSRFEVDFIKIEYEKLVKELKIKNAWEYERILSWFKEDKINVTEHISFSHPSYSEALEHLLVEHGHVTRVNKEIFIKVLNKLSNNNNEKAWDVAWTVKQYFDMLPMNSRNELLIRLSNKEHAAWGVTTVVTENYDKLPENVRNLLFKLSEIEETSGDVAGVIEQKFNKLPENVRNELLTKLSGKENAARGVTLAITKNYKKLPENVRSIIFKLIDKKETAGYLVRSIAGNYNMLPENVRNLLFQLCDKEETAGDVVDAMAEEWYTLPQNIKSKLLIILSDKEKAIDFVSWAVKDDFDKIPKDIRNELLNKLSERTTQDLKRETAEIFDELPEEIRNEILIKRRFKTKYTDFVNNGFSFVI